VRLFPSSRQRNRQEFFFLFPHLFIIFFRRRRRRRRLSNVVSACQMFGLVPRSDPSATRKEPSYFPFLSFPLHVCVSKSIKSDVFLTSSKRNDDPLFFTEYHNLLLLLSLAVNGHQGGYAYNRRRKSCIGKHFFSLSLSFRVV
jgi:hypothetical protein